MILYIRNKKQESYFKNEEFNTPIVQIDQEIGDFITFWKNQSEELAQYQYIIIDESRIDGGKSFNVKLWERTFTKEQRQKIVICVHEINVNEIILAMGIHFIESVKEANIFMKNNYLLSMQQPKKTNQKDTNDIANARFKMETPNGLTTTQVKLEHLNGGNHNEDSSQDTYHQEKPKMVGNHDHHQTSQNDHEKSINDKESVEYRPQEPIKKILEDQEDPVDVEIKEEKTAVIEQNTEEEEVYRHQESTEDRVEDDVVDEDNNKASIVDKFVLPFYKQKTRENVDEEDNEDNEWLIDALETNERLTINVKGALNAVGTTYIAFYVAQLASQIGRKPVVVINDHDYLKLLSANPYKIACATKGDRSIFKSDVIINDLGVIDMNDQDNLSKYEDCDLRLFVLSPHFPKMNVASTLASYLSVANARDRLITVVNLSDHHNAISYVKNIKNALGQFINVEFNAMNK